MRVGEYMGVWCSVVWCGREKDAPLGQVDNVWVASGSGGSYYLQRRGEGGVLSLGGGGSRSEQASLRKLDWSGWANANAGCASRSSAGH